MEFIVKDMLRVSRATDIPLPILIEKAQFFWTAASEDGDILSSPQTGHTDPLRQTWPGFPRVHAVAVAGWKTAVVLVDEADDPGLFGRLEEGTSPVPR